MKAFFFGCWNRAGHFLFTPSGECLYRADADLLGPAHRDRSIDGTLAPRRLRRSNTIVWALADLPRVISNSDECDEGYYLIHHINGFTFMSWWDRHQGDTRGACNSTFILEGTHDAVKMFDELVVHFPHVVENLRKANIPLRQVTL